MRVGRLAAAFLLLTVAAGCNPQPPKPTPAPSTAGSPRPSSTPLVLEITGKGTAKRPVELIQQVHNRIDYDLLASSYESRGPQGSTRAVFKVARVTFRDRTGSTITADAPTAIVDEGANTVTLTDGVHAHTSNGMTLQCDRLVYLRTAGRLHGSGHVVVTDPKGFRATGTSFDSDLSLTAMRMQ